MHRLLSFVSTTLITLSLLGTPIQSSAAALCTFTSAGDTCVLEWNATGIGPGPFDVGGVIYGYAGSSSAQVEYSWYEGLGATGAVVNTGVWTLDTLYIWMPPLGSPSWDDGVASLSLVSVSGVGGVELFTLDWRDIFFRSTYVPATVDTVGSVPEPGTLALLGLGLAGLAGMRRRRTQQ